jgi:membrane fusion protein, multidrug efflux system
MSAASSQVWPNPARDNGSARCRLRLRQWYGLGFQVMLVSILATGCNRSATPAKEKKIAVVVTTPIRDEVLDYQDFTGRIDAFRTIEIRARATGYVDAAPFHEGDVVHQGDVLFEIDPRTYQAQVDSAAADLANRKAQATKAEALYRRSLELLRTKASTQEDIDNQKGDWEVAKAAILQADAKLRESKLNLSFCHVTSPVNGRISRRNVDPGNLVKADDTVVTTIVVDDAVYAYFDVDERTYLDLVGEKPTGGARISLKDLKMPVLMHLANAEEFTHVGYVDFLDNRLNANTGTIRMRALFENPRHTLKAGLFVRIRLPIGSTYQALLIPDEAIQSDQGRKYIYVVRTAIEKKADGAEETKDVVAYVPVMPGQTLNGLRVIAAAKRDKDGKIVEGLAGGERVIISGMQRVRPDTVVEATMQPPPNPPDFPLRKLLNGTRAKESSPPARIHEVPVRNGQ